MSNFRPKSSRPIASSRPGKKPLKVIVVATLVVAASTAAWSQLFDPRSWFSSSPPTGSVAPAQQAPAPQAPGLQTPQAPAPHVPVTGAPPWSGESGASGHPDMQADAIRA